MAKRIIYTSKAPNPVGPYNQGVEINGTLYVSGQIPINPETSEVIHGSVQEETELAMNNLLEIIKEAGYSIEDVVKTTMFVKDLSNFALVNSIYASFFNEATAPARECVEVARLPKDVQVEISCIAIK